MDVEPDVSTGPDAGGAGVEPESRIHRGRLGPVAIAEGLLDLDSCTHGLERILEDAEETLPFEIDHRPIVSEGGVGHYLVVSGQDLGVLVSELLHEGGGPGQITEHEREGPHRQRVVVWLDLGEPL